MTGLEKAGWTIGCLKCRAMQEGDLTKGTLGHSAKCKVRIQEILAEDEGFEHKMAKAEARKNKYCEDVNAARTAAPPAATSSSSDSPVERPAPPPEHLDPDMDNEEAEFEIPVIPKRGRSEDDDEEPQVKRTQTTPTPTQASSVGEKRRREDDDQGDDVRMNRVDEDGDNVMNLKDDEHLDLQASISAKGGEDSGRKYSTYDVAEIFSPPRTAARARARGLKGGWSMGDKVKCPVTGRIWDLLNPGDQRAA